MLLFPLPHWAIGVSADARAKGWCPNLFPRVDSGDASARSPPPGQRQEPAQQSCWSSLTLRSTSNKCLDQRTNAKSLGMRTQAGRQPLTTCPAPHWHTSRGLLASFLPAGFSWLDCWNTSMSALGERRSPPPLQSGEAASASGCFGVQDLRMAHQTNVQSQESAHSNCGMGTRRGAPAHRQLCPAPSPPPWEWACISNLVVLSLHL